MATGAYKRLLGLLEAQRRDAVSEAGFSLGKQVVGEEQDIREIQSNIDKEIRRLEKAQRKRGRKKQFGGLLGSALGFALAGPLGLSASLGTGLGSLAGSRLAGQKKIRGIDPNLSLRENAEFFKQQGDNLSSLVDDISSQLEESYENEILSDVVTAAASGATGGRLSKTDFGKNLSSFFSDDIFGGKSLDLGQKVSNVGKRTGQRFGNLFGGRGFQTDAMLQQDSSLTGLQNILGIDDTPVNQRLEGLFGVQSPQDLTGQTLLDMDSYGPSVLSGGNTTANQLDVINRRNAETMQNLISKQSLPSTNSLISQYGQSSPVEIPGLGEDLAMRMSPRYDFTAENLFPAEELSGFLPRGGQLNIDDVRQRIIDGIPADYEGGAEQYARDFYGGAGEPDLTPEELTFLTTGQGGLSGFDADLLSGTLQDMVPDFLKGERGYNRYTGTEAATIDALRDSLYGLDDAPYFDAFPKPELNEQQIRQLLNAPQGDYSRLLQFYNLQRPE